MLKPKQRMVYRNGNIIFKHINNCGNKEHDSHVVPYFAMKTFVYTYEHLLASSYVENVP